MLRPFIPLAFILLWIVPVGWVGLMKSSYPLYPAWIASLFRVTGIFESAPSRWRIFYIEEEDQTGWHQVNEKLLFAPTPLGDRTRFQPLMNEMEDAQSKQVPKILGWIAGQLRQVHPSQGNVRAVRIIDFSIPSEAFLRCSSLAAAYDLANKTNMPKVVDAYMGVTPSP